MATLSVTASEFCTPQQTLAIIATWREACRRLLASRGSTYNGCLQVVTAAERIARVKGLFVGASGTATREAGGYVNFQFDNSGYKVMPRMLVAVDDSPGALPDFGSPPTSNRTRYTGIYRVESATATDIRWKQGGDSPASKTINVKYFDVAAVLALVIAELAAITDAFSTPTFAPKPRSVISGSDLALDRLEYWNFGVMAECSVFPGELYATAAEHGIDRGVASFEETYGGTEVDSGAESMQPDARFRGNTATKMHLLMSSLVGSVGYETGKFYSTLRKSEFWMVYDKLIRTYRSVRSIGYTKRWADDVIRMLNRFPEEGFTSTPAAALSLRQRYQDLRDERVSFQTTKTIATVPVTLNVEHAVLVPNSESGQPVLPTPFVDLLMLMAWQDQGRTKALSRYLDHVSAPFQKPEEDLVDTAKKWSFADNPCLTAGSSSSSSSEGCNGCSEGRQWVMIIHPSQVGNLSVGGTIPLDDERDIGDMYDVAVFPVGMTPTSNNTSDPRIVFCKAANTWESRYGKGELGYYDPADTSGIKRLPNGSWHKCEGYGDSSEHGQKVIHIEERNEPKC